MEPLRSISFEAPEDVAPSKWTMRIYSSKEALQDMPKLSWLEFVGQEIVPSIDFRNADDFRQYVGNMPDNNVAGVFYGKSKIISKGVYTFCTSSDDGSTLSVDGKPLVDNGGLHGNREQCAARDLAAGFHTVKVDWFQAYGGENLMVYYSGPDTGGKKILLPSAEQWAPALITPSKWRLSVYKSSSRISSTPDFSGKDVTIVGFALTPFVDLKNIWDFRKLVPNTPGNNLAWKIEGKLVIIAAGSYSVCTASHDGSLLYVDGDLVVKNDGLHELSEYCADRTLTAGTHPIDVTGFMNDGHPSITVTYSGPDTNGMKELMDSVGTPSPCLPIACPKNTDGLACNSDQIKNCKAIAGNEWLVSDKGM